MAPHFPDVSVAACVEQVGAVACVVAHRLPDPFERIVADIVVDVVVVAAVDSSHSSDSSLRRVGAELRVVPYRIDSFAETSDGVVIGFESG